MTEAVIPFSMTFEVSIGAATLMIILTWILTPIAILAARRYNWFDVPGKRRLHTQPTPRIGGLAIAASFLLVVPLTMYIAGRNGAISSEEFSALVRFFSCYGFLVLAGLVDDVRGLRPIAKLVCQAIAVLAAVETLPREVALFGFAFPEVVVSIVHVVWFLVLINAFNLIDGFDGLATPLALVSMLGLLGFLVVKDNWIHVVILSAYAGALVGFYPFNRYPAKIFLGDCGSMGIGFAFAFAAVSGGAKSGSLSAAFIPVFAAAIPLLDLILAVWRRLARRLSAQVSLTQPAQGIMIGDLEHLHHRLVARNLKPQDVAAVLILMNAIVVLIGIVALHVGFFGGLLAPIVLMVTIVVLLVGLPKPELYETGKLLYEVFCQARSRTLACVGFVIGDILVFAGGWTLLRLLLDESTTGLLSVTELHSFTLFTVGPLCCLVVTDTILGAERPKLALLCTGVTIGLSATMIRPLGPAALFATILVVALYFIRRSLATLHKLYDPAIQYAPVSFYGRLREGQRKRG